MRSSIFLFALTVLMMSAVFLIGSHFEVPFLLQLPPSTWPIPYLSVECFLLSGLAFLALTFRVFISRIIGIAIFLLALQRGLEILMPNDSKVYAIFSSVHFDLPNSSKMVLLAAMGFMSIGAVFIFWPAKDRFLLKNTIPLFLSSLVIFLGAVGIITALFSVQKTSHLQGLLIHFYTAVGFLLVGLGFLFAKFRKKEV